MTADTQIRLRPMHEVDLEMVLQWRNSDEVRCFMYSSRRFGLEEHRRWFDAVRVAVDSHPMILELQGNPAGFVNVGPVTDGGIARWGFYAAPGSPRGTGKVLGTTALEFAFRELRLHKIWGEALATNEASSRFHLRLGFRQEGMLVDQHFDGARYHDVVRFGLLASEWAESNGRGAI
jgi:UDP-4-amino-4,6-dideoxy-N-acetyl-beta-L-altrosamine N-acetyltransferase